MRNFILRINAISLNIYTAKGSLRPMRLKAAYLKKIICDAFIFLIQAITWYLFYIQYRCLKDFITSSPALCFSLLLLGIMIYLKTKFPSPFITNKSLRAVIISAALVFFLSGIGFIIYFFAKDFPWYYIEKAVAVLFFGITVTGFVVKKSDDPFDIVN